VLSKVAECISTGDWRDACGKAEFQPYVNVKPELAVDADRSIVLRQTRLVIPSALQQRIVDIAHAAHTDIEKTTSLIRTKCWFPRLHTLVDKTRQDYAHALHVKATHHKLGQWHYYR